MRQIIGHPTNKACTIRVKALPYRPDSAEQCFDSHWRARLTERFYTGKY